MKVITAKGQIVEKTSTKGLVQLFITAMFQVTFVAMNVIFISNEKWIPMLITGFMISLIWTLNVKKVAFGGWTDRFTYATGAMVGTGLGFLISTHINQYL